MKKIYHITTKENWSKAQAQGSYTFCSLDTEGFIHCSTPEQFLDTANRIFKGKSGLLLLEIDETKVGSEIKYENLEGGSEDFPHIYGPLEIDAVLQVFEFVAGSDGEFVSPLGG